MDKEQVWKAKRLGCISASELNDLFSRSGKVTEANMDYVRKKRFHRKHKFELPVTGRALEIGRDGARCRRVGASQLSKFRIWSMPKSARRYLFGVSIGLTMVQVPIALRVMNAS